MIKENPVPPIMAPKNNKTKNDRTHPECSTNSTGPKRPSNGTNGSCRIRGGSRRISRSCQSYYDQPNKKPRRSFAGASRSLCHEESSTLEKTRSVELIVHPEAKDGVGEMGVGEGLSP